MQEEELLLEVRHKVSGAQAFARIRGYLSTLRRQRIAVLTVLE